MRRAFAVTAVSLVLSTAALALLPSEADACSCMRSPSAVEAARGADAVFTAKLVSSKDVPPSGQYGVATKVFTFEVTRTFKGQLDAKVNVSTADNSAACGRSYGDPGSEWLIYAKIDGEGQTRDNLCSRTTALDKAAEDITELEANADSLDQEPNDTAAEPEPVEPSEPEPEPVIPPDAEDGPEPGSPSKKGCSVADGDLGPRDLGGALAGLLGLGLIVGWRHQRRL